MLNGNKKGKEFVKLVEDVVSKKKLTPIKPETIDCFSEDKIKEAYTDGFNDSRFDFDIENYK